MLQRFHCLALCMLLAIANTCQGQSTNNIDGFGIETNVFTGRVVRHESKFTLPIPAITSGLDLNFVWNTWGRKSWHQLRRYPTLGIGFVYTDYGINYVYGQAFSIYPNITFPIVKGKNLEWSMRIGDGVAYVTRHFSRTNPVDTVNVAIGSHINDYANFSTDLRLKMNQHWDVQIGANFSHISNASFKTPNLGVNLPGIHAGFRYFPATSTPAKVKWQHAPPRNNWGIGAIAAVAANQPPAAGGPAYPVYIGSIFIYKKWLHKNKLYFGADYSYHESIYTFLRNNYIDAGSEASHSTKQAVLAGNEFLLGRIGVILQLGYYVKDAALSQGAIYEKLGGNLYLVKNQNKVLKEVYIHAALKAHLAVAELAEFGIGLSI